MIMFFGPIIAFVLILYFILFVIAFLIPTLGILGIFKIAKRIPKPSTQFLTYRLDHIGDPFPDTDIFVSDYTKYLLETWSKTPRKDLFRILVRTAGTLYTTHNFVPLKPDTPQENDAILQGRYRDQLIRGIETGLDAPHILAVIQTAFTESYTELLRKLPPSSFTEDITNESMPMFTVPLYDMVRNPGQTVADVIKPFQSKEIQQRKLFSGLREQLNRNLYEASGVDCPAPEKKLIHPWQYEGSAGDIVKAYLGYTPLQYIFDQHVPFPITDERRFEHWSIVGSSGSGKTQTLQHIIMHDLMRPDPPSLVIIDSQGDMLWKIQHLKLFADDPDRLIIIDPQYDPSLNIFDMTTDRLRGYSPILREQVEAGIFELYQYIFGAIASEMTSKQGTAFVFVVRLMLAVEGATLHTLLDLMEDQSKSFKDSPFFEYAPKLDDTARTFFQNQFFNKTAFGQTKQQLARRLYAILSVPAFNRSFAAQKNKLDMFTALQSGKVVLVNTAKNLLKTDASALFGRYMIAQVMAAIFERVVLPPQDRKSTFLIIDESAEYIDENLESLLTQARKYRLGALFAFQHMQQLTPALRSAVATNTTIKFAGGVSDQDARTFDADMRTSAQFITSMKKHTKSTEFAAYIRNDTPTAVRLEIPFGTLEAAPRMTEEEHRTLIDRNRARYSSDFHKPTPPPPPPKTFDPANDSIPRSSDY